MIIRKPMVARVLSPCDLQKRPQRTVLVLDCSGSMAADDYLPSRLGAAMTSAVSFTQGRASRSRHDCVGVVSFGSRARCECGLKSVSDLEAIIRAIYGIQIGKYTAIGAGLRAAERLLLPDKSRGALSRFSRWLRDGDAAAGDGFTSRVILLTDGHHCHGVAPLPVATRLKSAGVQIDCIGIGGCRLAVDESLLRDIASLDEVTGEPRYRFIGDSRALAKHFESLARGITR